MPMVDDNEKLSEEQTAWLCGFADAICGYTPMPEIATESEAMAKVYEIGFVIGDKFATDYGYTLGEEDRGLGSGDDEGDLPKSIESVLTEMVDDDVHDEFDDKTLVVATPFGME